MFSAATIPYIKIRPFSLCCYNVVQNIKKNLFSHTTQPDERLKTGKLSASSQRKIKNSIEWLLFTSRNNYVIQDNKRFNFKLSFITLTLPSSQIAEPIPIWSVVNRSKKKIKLKYSDEYIKRECLNLFLLIMKRKYNLHQYVWRAETQENGNVHFHITSNIFIPYTELQQIWNKILNLKTNLIKEYHAKFSAMSFEQYYIYRKISNKSITKSEAEASFNIGKQSNWYNPNSVDVHSVKKIKNISSYLISYFSKNNENYRYVTGQQWRCSHLLSKLQAAKIIITNKINKEIQPLLELKNKLIQLDYALIIKVGIDELKKIFKNSALVEIFNNYYNETLLNYSESKYFNKRL